MEGMPRRPVEEIQRPGASQPVIADIRPDLNVPLRFHPCPCQLFILVGTSWVPEIALLSVARLPRILAKLVELVQASRETLLFSKLRVILSKKAFPSQLQPRVLILENAPLQSFPHTGTLQERTDPAGSGP